MCCGSEGTSLALEASTKFSEVEIRRVSHLGGHRFAPTAITFPEGRMWSHLNMEDLQIIFSASSIDDKLTRKCRGWCGSETGAEQVAEREGLKIYGRDWDRYVRKSEIISEENSEIRVQVDGIHPESGSQVGFEAVLEEVEKTPVLSCDKAGSIPNKWQRQYEIKKINVHLRKICKKYKCKFKIDYMISGESFITKPNKTTYMIRDIIKKNTKKNTKLSTSGGTSDARFIRKISPCLEFGMVGASMHQVDENIKVSDLKTLTKIHKEILENYFS